LVMNKCGFNSSLSVFYPNDLFKVKAAMLVGGWRH
jgi:hypothetical protein